MSKKFRLKIEATWYEEVEAENEEEALDNMTGEGFDYYEDNVTVEEI